MNKMSLVHYASLTPNKLYKFSIRYKKIKKMIKRIKVKPNFKIHNSIIIITAKDVIMPIVEKIKKVKTLIEKVKRISALLCTAFLLA
jgi:hypothetical protein